MTNDSRLPTSGLIKCEPMMLLFDQAVKEKFYVRHMLWVHTAPCLVQIVDTHMTCLSPKSIWLKPVEHTYSPLHPIRILDSIKTGWYKSTVSLEEIERSKSDLQEPFLHWHHPATNNVLGMGSVWDSSNKAIWAARDLNSNRTVSLLMRYLLAGVVSYYTCVGCLSSITNHESRNPLILPHSP